MNLQYNGFDNNSTYFERSLSSSNIPTIFVHGVGLDHKMWLPQINYFHDKNVIFYDLLNHGRSKKCYKELKFINFTNQLIQLVNFLKISKFNLIGFSIGALIAQHFTSAHYKRVNKLIIIASVYKRSIKQKKIIKNRYKMALEGKSITVNSINRWFNREYLKTNPDVYSYFFHILEKKNVDDFLPAYKLFVESDNYVLDFSNFIMPTLIMTGENEVGSTPEMSKMLCQQINKSTIYIIPNAKHMATYEKSDLVNAKISKFIS